MIVLAGQNSFGVCVVGAGILVSNYQKAQDTISIGIQLDTVANFNGD